MLCRNLKHILSPNTPDKPFLISTRQFSRQWINILFVRIGNKTNMSSPLKLRHIFRDLVLARLFSVWTRSCFVSSVVRRYRKDGRVREVIQCFRHGLLRPRRSLFLTVTAAYKNNEEKSGPPGPCKKDITDQELADLIEDLVGMEELCKATLYCPGCDRRVVIDSARPGIRYCQCDKTQSPEQNFDGWEPFLEAEEIIIWRKEYKPGPLYAYKVYGRYKVLEAHDFAAIQVDGRYRKVWDTAVASLSVVEHEANGKSDQDVLHWEVLWPRFFANRDYVYLRRHKEFSVKSQPHPHKDRVFDTSTPQRDAAVEIHERPERPVGRKAERPKTRRKALKGAEDLKEEPLIVKEEKSPDDHVYVIVSRSCTHDQVPASNNAIRVTEYWSHMVVKTTNGPDMPGMEFVLTYYDEPAVGGLPTAVTAWAMGRAGPAFLERMRAAAIDYRQWKQRNPLDTNEKPDFTPFTPEKVPGTSPEIIPEKPPEKKPENVSLETKHFIAPVSELEMESSRQGPVMGEDSSYRDQATQTTGTVVMLEDVKEIENDKPTPPPTNLSDDTPPDNSQACVQLDNVQASTTTEGDALAADEENECEDQQSWWSYIARRYELVVGPQRKSVMDTWEGRTQAVLNV